MSYILLRAIEKNLKRTDKGRYSNLFEDIDEEYGKARKVFFGSK